jgi:galactonate dehydratase
MVTTSSISRIEPIFLRVSAKTVWSFVRIKARDGATGIGEATLPGHEQAVAGAIADLDSALRDFPADPRGIASLDMRKIRGDRAQAAALSAIDQALWDIAAQRRGKPLHAVLGTRHRGYVAVYANINRRTIDRAPAGFADSARDALAAGHRAVKIAPFDELTSQAASSPGGRKAIEAGLARIAAVRDAIGPGTRLLIDCHWRFDEPSAGAMVADAAAFDPYWIECPLPETAETIASLVRLRGIANDLGIRLASAEQESFVEGFRPFIDAGAYDVMMPDVKYAGGLKEMLRIAEAFDRAGVAFSPHNPSGPVAHAVTLHVAAVTNGLSLVEMQFDESPLFTAIVTGDLPRPDDGASRVPGLFAGLGLDLVNEETLATLPAARLQP